mmetsp:Transcript_6868/g.21636  ORF Transcript_6868/g.21636 Transcript_6868/m.21636 type:complete len:374 (-) Transcript_6868:12-1133(-)
MIPRDHRGSRQREFGAGIGYGDVGAHTRPEYALCVFCIMSTSIFWAFLIGNFCAIVASMDKHPARFRGTMDDLNSMLAASNLDPDLSARVRDYFGHSRNLVRARDYHDLDMQLSVGMRGEVAGHVSNKQLEAVWYFRESSEAFRRELAMLMVPLMFAPFETVDSGQALLVIQRGLVMYGGRMLKRGDHVGRDFIVVRDEARIARQAALGLVENRTLPSAFTYVEVLELRQGALRRAFPMFPREARRIRAASAWVAFKLAMMRWARMRIAEARKRKNSRGEAIANSVVAVSARATMLSPGDTFADPATAAALKARRKREEASVVRSRRRRVEMALLRPSRERRRQRSHSYAPSFKSTTPVSRRCKNDRRRSSSL